MSALIAEELAAVTDLVIHEFDAWSNPTEPMFLPPCGSSWCGPDLADPAV